MHLLLRNVEFDRDMMQTGNHNVVRLSVTVELSLCAVEAWQGHFGDSGMSQIHRILQDGLQINKEQWQIFHIKTQLKKGSEKNQLVGQVHEVQCLPSGEAVQVDQVQSKYYTKYGFYLTGQMWE